MTRMKIRRSRQHGGVTLMLIMVLILLAALVGALAVRGSFSELRMMGAERQSRTSFYCAEAGLNAARPIVGANPGQWNNMLNWPTTTVVGITYPITGSITGGIGTVDSATGKPDYRVTIVDNKDEYPLADNPLQDNDLSVILVSDCLDADPNNAQVATSDMGTRELRELATYGGSLPNDYRFQAGHSSTHSGNEN